VLGSGYLGVDLFFLLSGFIITYVHRRDTASLAPKPALRFYGLRLARIYPVHLAMLLVLVPVVLGGGLLGFHAHHPEMFQGRDFVLSLLLLQAWTYHSMLVWNFPSWSVSCEWFAYLLFPCLAILLNRLSGARQTALWLALETTAFALAYVFLFHGDIDRASGGLALARVSFEFVAGALGYRLTEFADLKRWPWTALVIAAMVAAAAAGPAHDILAILTFALAILAGRYRSNMVARLLRLPVLVYLGEISYSLYMVHEPVEMTFGKFAYHVIETTSSRVVDFTALAVFLAFTIAVAAAAHHFLEVPARNWLRRRYIDRLERRTEEVETVMTPFADAP
jgi:peptidoglycan/LPS O-acetylase OafA/YrhL